MINHTYINSDGNRLFCCYSSNHFDENKIGILMLQPFAEERVLMQRALFNLANDLSDKSFPVCRFDFYGQGDSDGEFNDANIIKWQVNLLDAISSFKKKFKLTEVILCGIRFGATLAMSITNKLPTGIHRFILIDPIINGEQYIEGVLRTNLTYQMVTHGEILETRDVLIERLQSGELVNIDGYLINGDFFSQIRGINLKKLVCANKNILILHYAKKNKRLPKSLMSYCEHLRDCKCQVSEKSISDSAAWKASELYSMNLSNTLNEICKWLNKPCIENINMEYDHD